MVGRLRKRWRSWVRTEDSVGPTVEELRSVKNTADYLADAIKAAPGGQLDPVDLEKLRELTENLDALKDKMKEIDR